MEAKERKKNRKNDLFNLLILLFSQKKVEIFFGCLTKKFSIQITDKNLIFLPILRFINLN
jgi:hypothetical protein